MIGLNEYNKAADENDWPLWTYSGDEHIAETTFTCTVKAMVSDSYGKMPNDGFN